MVSVKQEKRFLFRKEYLQCVEDIEKESGAEAAYEAMESIIRYGLYKEIPEDDNMKLLINKVFKKEGK